MKIKRIEIINFIRHLRLSYLILILSSVFLVGGLFSINLNVPIFIFQYINIHVLLFGGVTAFNSYWDRDTGPISGLKKPPQMKPWMLSAAIVMQLLGLLFALVSGLQFFLVYIPSMLLSYLYSHPTYRFKAKPFGSIIIISLGIIGTVFLGFLASGPQSNLPIQLLAAAFAYVAVGISIYPISQMFQVDEDRKRGDTTFAVRFGKRGIVLTFRLLFPVGFLLFIYAIAGINWEVTRLFLVAGIPAIIIIDRKINAFKLNTTSYDLIMRSQYIGSISLIFIILILFFLK